MTRYRCLLALIALFLLFAAGCGKADTPAKASTPMTQKQMLDTRPLCVGRFLIDVPIGTKVVGTQTTSSYAAGTISVQSAVSKAAFKARMEGVEKELRNAPHKTEGSRFSELSRPDDTSYLFRYRKNDVGARVYQIDGYRWTQSAVFAVNSGSSNDLFQSVLNDVKRGLFAMKSRDTWAIPTQPGFCFDNGFLPGSEASFEATGVQLAFKDYPGLAIFMETRVHTPSPVEEPSLFDRTDAAMKLMESPDKPSVLRRRKDRPTSIGAAEEVLWKHSRDGVYTLNGDVEANGSNRRLDKPDTAFSIVLDPPKDGSPQPDEDAVIRLWDTVVDSLRLRPGAL